MITLSTLHKRRLLYLIVLTIGISITLGLAMYALRENINLFFTPTEIKHQHLSQQQQVRLGGMVKQGSVVHIQNTLTTHFIVTDYKNEIAVIYQGILPDLFREGQGVVAQGIINTSGQFVAQEVLAKHDEKYMPPQITAAMNENSHAR